MRPSTCSHSESPSDLCGNVSRIEGLLTRERSPEPRKRERKL